MAAEAPGKEDTVTVTGVPGLTEILEGETLTPWGSPVGCTEIAEEKPLMEVADSEVVMEPPAEIETDVGLNPKLKSGTGGGGV
jgi:hypothetical protein